MMQFTNGQQQRIAYDSYIQLQTNGRPTTFPYSAYNVQLGIVNNVLYVSGGNTGNASTVSMHYGLDLATNMWTSKATIPISVFSGATCTFNNKIYVFGGCNYGANAGNTQIYDPVTNTWSSGANMSISRFGAWAQVINGLIYVLGGIVNYSSPSYVNVLECYDPVLNTWSTKATPPTMTYGWKTAWVYQNKLYAVTNGVLSVYDPATNAWSTRSSGLGGPWAFMLDDVVYLFGETSISNGAVSFYYPDLDTTAPPKNFTARNNYKTTRYNQAVTMIQNPLNPNEIFSLGGCTNGNSPTNALDIFIRKVLYDQINDSAVCLRVRSDSNPITVRNVDGRPSIDIGPGQQDGPFTKPKVYVENWASSNIQISVSTN
ncbi:hypothetical protein JJB07_06175 [Tumebacillus sp. ITR2]|uniref:Galactose oxidase n=1 Tax=Tumebacillus amylolyticus TaxID=2801339 RepID=A0ABS1J7I5_9BACL|nr:kelch repeat-containing protein [Tumebacillus amylolyticus]MBL0386238.1 hypothetical protein [Tumebacillus amylolyticus]